MSNDKKELGFLNLLLWLLGAIFLGELFIQILFRLGLEISSLNHYLTLQLIIYLPLGILSYFATRVRLSKFVSVLTTIFSVYIINFASMLVYSFEDPLAYIKENQEETLKAFGNNTLLLLPLLIGYVFTLILIKVVNAYRNRQAGSESTEREPKTYMETVKETFSMVMSPLMGLVKKERVEENASKQDSKSSKKAK